METSSSFDLPRLTWKSADAASWVKSRLRWGGGEEEGAKG